MRGALAALVAAGCHVAATGMEARVNPIRKVVNMLKMMEVKVEEEAKKKEELFDEYMCYCKKSQAEIKVSIATAVDRIPQLTSTLEEAKSQHKQLTQDVTTHHADRDAAEEALQGANALRKQEKQAFEKESANARANINAIRQAIASLEKGRGGGFLQTSAVTMLKKLSLALEMSSADRDVLASFLSSGAASQDESESGASDGEIIGILKQMADEMDRDLAEMVVEEEQRAGNHESLVSAKAKEISAATKSIEAKTGRAGELAVDVATLTDDLEDAQVGLESDRGMSAELDKSCGSVQAEWAAFQKMHAEEKVALAETIKLLNDDASNEVFSATLPNAAAASFLQVASTVPNVGQEAAGILSKAKRGDHRISFLVLALHGQKKGFDQVIQKIDGLITMLRHEQDNDDKKQHFCVEAIDKTEDELKAAQRQVKDTGTVMSEAKEKLESTVEDINALVQGIQALDRDVKEATGIRQREHAQSVEELAANNAAKNLLEIAKNRLNKFYNNNMYKPPAKTELSAQDRIAENFGVGNTAPVAALVQVKMHSVEEAKPNAPPDLGFKKSSEEAGGVMEMLNLLKVDLAKQITEIETVEKQAQAEYEALMRKSKEKRALDSKAIGDKEKAKAELEAKVHSHKEDLAVQSKDVGLTQNELDGLHSDCDWLLKNHAVRAEARADEVDSLQKAKAVLSGASYG